MQAQNKRLPQDGDLNVASPPTDGITSVSLNGNQSMNPTILVATAWDNTVFFSSSILSFLLDENILIFS